MSVMISPQHPDLQYMGRIDFANPNAPDFIWPYSMVKLRFTGSRADVLLENRRVCWESYLGVWVDGVQNAVRIPEDEKEVRLPLIGGLGEGWHELTVFKRMDSCHVFSFHGLLLEEGAVTAPPAPLPQRRIEVYGDSVSAGEVSEATEYVGRPDPEHHGEYSNAWYSYAAITARRLGAQLHDVAQGGIPLLDGTGWFAAPFYPGMESVWDKLQYHPELGPAKLWDFSRYTPQVVVVAIGQNDSHPVEFMKDDYDGPQAVRWRETYRRWILALRAKYPQAQIILATTILGHDESWDRAIGEVCRSLGDAAVHHFLYTRNGCGTPGHIRIPEAEEMAAELSAFIESLGEGIWEHNKVGG